MAKRRKRRAASAEDARTRFLAAAERLFAAHGYDGTSIRAIAQEAGANLATLTHYWGTKRGLFRDLFERRFRALSDEYLRRFRRLASNEALGKPAALRELLLAMIETPYVVSAVQAARLGDPVAIKADRRLFHLLFGRALTDPSEDVVGAMNGIFKEMIKLFFSLLRGHRQDMDPQEFYWRVVCISGAQVFAQGYSQRVGRFLEHALDDLDDPMGPERMVHFLLAGMTAPAMPVGPAPGAESRSRKRAIGAA